MSAYIVGVPTQKNAFGLVGGSYLLVVQISKNQQESMTNVWMVLVTTGWWFLLIPKKLANCCVISPMYGWKKNKWFWNHQPVNSGGYTLGIAGYTPFWISSQIKNRCLGNTLPIPRAEQLEIPKTMYLHRCLFPQWSRVTGMPGGTHVGMTLVAGLQLNDGTGLPQQ